MKQLLITAILTLLLAACATPSSSYKEFRAEGMTHSEAMDLIDAEQRKLEAQLQWNNDQQLKNKTEHTTILVR